MDSDKIVESEEYGTHIALSCVNHPDLRWSTKNIAPLGCRTIFYNLYSHPEMGPECDCSVRDLRPIVTF